MGCLRASAQDTDGSVPKSNALFETGLQQFSEGEVAAACESFSESYRLAPRPGTLLNLGLCHERAGELLLARRELGEAGELARRTGRTDREALANEHIRAIDARLGWLNFRPMADFSRTNARLLLDGAPLTVQPEQPVAVMPGDHTLRFEADGFEPRELTLDVGQGAELSVVFQPLQPLAAPLQEPVPVVASQLPAHTSESSGSNATPRTVALVTGIVGIAAGLACGAWALERKGVVSEHCSSDRTCDERGLAAASTGSAAALASTIGFAVGATAFGVWLFLPGGPINPETEARSGAGLTLRGKF